MKLSIIIPVYNKEAFLKDCLDSILGSTALDFEILLVDDGSVDSSLSICQDYSNRYPFVRTIPQQNEGVSSARNTGIAHAAGEYIAFVDADDFVKPSYWRQIEAALEYNADFYLFNYTRWLDSNHQEKGGFSIPEGYYESSKILDGQIAGLEICVLSVCGAIYKANLIRQQHLMFRPGMKTCEDFLFNICYIQNINTLYASPSSAYCYRLNPDSATGKRPLSHAEDYEYVYTAIKGYFKDKKMEKELQVLSQRRWIRWTIGLVNNWKSQHINRKQIWDKLEDLLFYREMKNIKPESAQAVLERWLLKHQLDNLIVLYMWGLQRMKVILKHYKL